MVAKLGNNSKTSTWTADQCKNVAAFMRNLPGEMMVDTWNKITESQNINNIQKMHKLIGVEIVNAVNESRNLK